MVTRPHLRSVHHPAGSAESISSCPDRPRLPGSAGVLVAGAAWVLCLGLAGALLAGCAATGADEPTRSAAQAGYPGVERNLTRIAPDQRKPAPVVAGPALDGAGTVSTADYRGQVLVINVWGSWCAPCRKEAPALQAASVRTAGVAQFVGITTKDPDPAAAQAFVRAFKVTYPSIFDPSGQALLTFAGDLPPSAIPSTLIVDAQGRLAVRVLGEVSEITLVNMIDDVADGR